jgi:hypothetical protein
MTEKELLMLGFQKEILEDYVDEENPNYYYVLDIVDGLTFITSSRDELKGDDWHVDIFNTDPIIRFHKMEKVQALINTFQNAIVK